MKPFRSRPEPLPNFSTQCSRKWISVPRAVSTALAAAFVAAVITAQAAQAQTFTLLYSFQGGTDAVNPLGNLILDESGTLYGTTRSGGTIGRGTVFEVSQSGEETVLYSFTGGTDGQYPQAGLVRDAAGNLYGTTIQGGNGGGTLFKLDASDNFSVVYTFTGYPIAQGGLVLDASGNLYGTTQEGDGSGGSVFKVDPTGKETVLYRFGGLPDGALPNGNLVRDKAGNLFGTTWTGGAGPCYYGQGCGTVFKLSKSGKETIVYRFLGVPDGAFPYASVIPGASGNFYATTVAGGYPGCNIYGPGCGTVFKVDLSGREDILYRFQERKDEGLPVAGLVRDSAGNLYGITGSGTAFRLDKRSKETVLHRFSGGDSPFGTLTLDEAGNLYGTTEFGGTFGYGMVFKIVP